MDQTPSKSPVTAIVLGTLGLIVLLWLAFSTTVAIGPGRVGVVTQLGKVTGREMHEGLNFKAPWPIQKVWVADTRIHKEQADANAGTADLQSVNATLALNYHLTKGAVSNVFQTIGPEWKGRVVDPAVQESFKAVAARFTASELLTKRAEVKDATVKNLRERLEKYGVSTTDLSIVNFHFSKEFDQAIEQKQVAQQEAERAQFILERARKEAEAQRAQAGTLTAEILQRMAIEKWNGSMPQYLGGGAVFNIPLTR